jgi:hypothetical protein
MQRHLNQPVDALEAPTDSGLCLSLIYAALASLKRKVGIKLCLFWQLLPKVKCHSRPIACFLENTESNILR